MCQLVAREREGAVCSFTISKRISICCNNGLKRERERERERERNRFGKNVQDHYLCYTQRAINISLRFCFLREDSRAG